MARVIAKSEEERNRANVERSRRYAQRHPEKVRAQRARTFQRRKENDPAWYEVRKAYLRAYYHANKDRLYALRKERDARHRAEDPEGYRKAKQEKTRRKHRNYRRKPENREKERAYGQRYRAEMSEERKAARRLYEQWYRQTHRPGKVVNARRYRERHAEQIRHKKAQYHATHKPIIQAKKKRDREQLVTYYVAGRLGVRVADLRPEILEAYQAIIRVKRLLRGKKVEGVSPSS